MDSTKLYDTNQQTAGDVDHEVKGPRSITQAVFDSVGPEDIAKAESPSTKMALALAATGRKVYEGTVPATVRRRRRARNKAARLARRAAR